MKFTFLKIPILQFVIYCVYLFIIYLVNPNENLVDLYPRYKEMFIISIFFNEILLDENFFDSNNDQMKFKNSKIWNYTESSILLIVSFLVIDFFIEFILNTYYYKAQPFVRSLFYLYLFGMTFPFILISLDYFHIHLKNNPTISHKIGENFGYIYYWEFLLSTFFVIWSVIWGSSALIIGIPLYSFILVSFHDIAIGIFAILFLILSFIGMNFLWKMIYLNNLDFILLNMPIKNQKKSKIIIYNIFLIILPFFILFSIFINVLAIDNPSLIIPVVIMTLLLGFIFSIQLVLSFFSNLFYYNTKNKETRF